MKRSILSPVLLRWATLALVPLAAESAAAALLSDAAIAALAPPAVAGTEAPAAADERGALADTLRALSTAAGDLARVRLPSPAAKPPAAATRPPAASPGGPRPSAADWDAEAVDVAKAPRPVALGDALYAAGLYRAAARAYDAALKRPKPERAAWARFQMGNCLRRLKAYKSSGETYATLAGANAGPFWTREGDWQARWAAWLHEARTALAAGTKEDPTAGKTGTKEGRP
jgi:hypothetical protein